MRGIRYAAVAGLCASCALGQVNRGFETGDLTAYQINDNASGQTTAVGMTDNGLLPTQGSFCARIQAGLLSQSEAESLMDLPSGRLAQLYLDLGGTPGQEFDGDYNVLRVCLPCGDYTFDYVFESGDDGDANFLDHGFVVNSAGQITVLDDTAGGLEPFWQQITVGHPGGDFFFVAANGADTAVDGTLFIDDTILTDPDNRSFETGNFNEWTLDDNGSGQGSVVNATDSGLPPTAGAQLARLQAGTVDQATAESIMGLSSGRLADLYLDLGGEPGQEFDGDYIILSQPLKGSSVMFDFAYEDGDFGDSTFLDHAFVVNSMGQITVLVNSLDIGGDVGWTRRTVPHSGGQFFFVAANGGDTSFDPELYVDRVIDGSPKLTNVAAWNGVESVFSWGGGGSTETYGQTFTAPPASALKNVKFFIEDLDAAPVEYEAYVYAWDGDKPTGPALFQSPVRSTDGVGQGFELVSIPTPGTFLEPGEEYVVFLTVLNTLPTGGGAGWGEPAANTFPGGFVFSNADTFGALFTTNWSQDFLGPDFDLACELEFGPPNASVVPNVNEFVAGPSNNAFPWNSGGDFRYQQLYTAAQFCGRSGVVDRFSYRTDSIGNAFGPMNIQAQIWLGYSDKAPGSMDLVFDNNFSSGKTMVYDGPVTLGSNGNGGFDIMVDVDNAFVYDPDQGNLLVEIKLPPNQPPTVQFDSAGYGLGAGGTPWTDRVWTFGQNAASGSSDGDDGPVTRFFFGPAEVCYPDCNNDGELNILDFVCFQQRFQMGDPYTDCNNDGNLNILDFVCFQQEFQMGCP